MGFYNDVVLPRLCDLAMRNKRFGPYRDRVVGAAEGRVLEVGAGLTSQPTNAGTAGAHLNSLPR
jgi:hypothetical protein